MSVSHLRNTSSKLSSRRAEVSSFILFTQPLSPRALAFEQPEAVRNQGGGDGKQNSTIGMILGCVVVVVGFFIVSFAIIIRKRRKRDAGTLSIISYVAIAREELTWKESE